MSELENTSRKILICYASVGSGHKAAALPLQEHLDIALYKFYTIDLIDSLIFFNSFLQKIFRNSQLKMTNFWGGIYDYWWYDDSFIPSEKKLSLFFNYFGREFKKYILETNPRVIISTHALPAIMVAQLKNKGLLPETLHVAINTDFRAHSFWPSTGVDLYIAASEEAEKDFMRMNVALERVYVLGIPIKSFFAENKSKYELKKTFVDNDLPIVLFLAGSLQKGLYKHIANKLFKLIENFKVERRLFNLFIVTGKDKKLKEKLDEYQRDYNIKEMQVFGFLERMDKIMSASDLLITKPGGLITSEALAVGLPMLLLGPNFGQERANRNYLVKKQAALYLEKRESLYQKSSTLIKDFKRLERMSGHAKEISKPQAVKNIAALIKKNL